LSRNVEIKARVADLDAVARLAAGIATGGPTRIEQDDTFFEGARGRLKLRQFGDGSGQLIHYDRADAAGPKVSDYVLSATAEPDSLRAALTRAYGVRGRMRKVRTLYLAGRTRIHLDRVEGLGSFVELEVVLGEGEGAEAGRAEAGRIMQALGIAPRDLVEGAYLDLMQEEPAK
jgi:adenylate cyclase class IV